jgi:uncharacterized membrane protein YfcA
MPDPVTWLILVTTALVGSIIGGVAGFGAGVLLLPVAAWTLGIRMAIPVLTITMMLGNISRIWWSRGEIDRRVAGRFLAGAVPATAVGTVFFVAASSDALSRLLGAFLLASVPLRRLLERGHWRVRLVHFPFLGLFFGTLSSLVVVIGAALTPFYLAYGLRRGTYIATEAVCAFTMHLTRGATLARYRLITAEVVLIGLALGLVMFVGSWIGRRLLDRMSDRMFLAMIEALIVVMGLQFLFFPR